MSFTKWAFIYLGTGKEDPARERAVIEHGGLTTTFVAVPDRSMAPQVAADLVNEGAQSIELCGAFGPLWTSRVIEATGGKVPVGAVTYGQESIAGLAMLFSNG